MAEKRYTLEEIKSAFMYAFLFKHETADILEESWLDLERNLLSSDEYKAKYHSDEAAQAQPAGGECKRCCGVGKLVDPDGTWDYCDCIEVSCPCCGVDWPRDVITSEAFLCGGCGIEYNAKRLWQLKSEKAEEAGGEYNNLYSLHGVQ